VAFLSVAVGNGTAESQHHLTMCAALDLADAGIRVNTVGSGMIGTPVGSRDPSARPFDMPRIPLGYLGDPRDIANAVGFLCSAEATFITGAPGRCRPRPQQFQLR
jgi:NAD(P)-dependent dehydrogenase (short-subunit alcohol dehydrogenase family)